MVTTDTFQNGTDAKAAALFGSCLFMAIIIIFSLAVTALTVWAFCRIFSKAGYHWALGLLMLVPFGGIIVPLILAFGEWPIYKKLSKPQTQNSPTPESWRNR